ncbi:MAG: phage tail protein [Xanthobacteraceae bacterium]
MSGLKNLFRGNQTATTPDYTGLQIQTAVNTLPIPIVWGMSKLAPNVIWYNDFQTHNGGSGGKGGLFSSGSSETTYSASVILALCEGLVTGISSVYKGQSIYSPSALGLTLFTGTDPQSPWNYVAANYSSQALGYEGTAYVCVANYSLGDNATLDNHNFEMQGLRYGSGYGQTPYTTYVAEVYSNIATGYWNGVTPSTGFLDADPALCIEDFLTNAQFGVGFPGASIDATTLFTQGGGNDASYQTYCRAIGLALSPCLADQEQASSILARWLQLTNSAAVWSGGLLRFIPYGDGAVTGNGITFNPNVTPIYNLGDDDFKVEDNEDPLQVSRTDPFEAYNVWRLECADRNNAYNLTTVESRDQNAIELVEQATGSNGMRIAPTVTAHEICDIAVASISGQLMVQRAVYIRNTYKFRLSWEYCLLDPMDLVTVTDSILGLANAAIRITEIEEDENGFLSVTAEEFPLGVATATLYPTQSVSNNPINRGAPADPVNPPIMFEPPSALVTAPQVWIAVSGGSGGTADPNWGGCNVLLSLDGMSYSQIGTVTAPARMGATTAALASFSGTNPDTSDTLSLNLTESAGVLQSVSAADAAAGNSLCIVDDELIAFTNATLTSSYHYNLTTLYRGLYGSVIASHATGASFARLDGTIFAYDLPAQYVGKELYLKFQSFNVFGGGVQELSACTAYTYTPTGVAVDHPVAQEILLAGGSWDFGLTSETVATEDDFGVPVSLTVEYDLNFGNT